MLNLAIPVYCIDAEWQLRHVPLHIPALVGRRPGKDLGRDFRVLLKLLVITSDAPRTASRAASLRGCLSARLAAAPPEVRPLATARVPVSAPRS
jgi:hypothetical protein